MKISKEMTIGEVVRNYPESIKVLAGFGMSCVGCPSAQSETLEEACQVHRINIDEIIVVLNESVK